MELMEVIAFQIKLRPLMEIQDVYKMLYQAYLGIGHLIADKGKAINYLTSELATCTDHASDDLLWENISPNETVGRINLRPFLHHKMDRDALVRKLMIFAPNPPGTKADLISAWEVVGALIEQSKLPFHYSAYQCFTSTVVAQDFPVMHHSQNYSRLYKPAYRILSTELYHQLRKQN